MIYRIGIKEAGIRLMNNPIGRFDYSIRLRLVSVEKPNHPTLKAYVRIIARSGRLIHPSKVTGFGLVCSCMCIEDNVDNPPSSWQAVHEAGRERERGVAR